MRSISPPVNRNHTNLKNSWSSNKYAKTDILKVYHSSSTCHSSRIFSTLPPVASPAVTSLTLDDGVAARPAHQEAAAGVVQQRGEPVLQQLQQQVVGAVGAHLTLPVGSGGRSGIRRSGSVVTAGVTVQWWQSPSGNCRNTGEMKHAPRISLYVASLLANHSQPKDVVSSDLI